MQHQVLPSTAHRPWRTRSAEACPFSVPDATPQLQLISSLPDFQKHEVAWRQLETVPHNTPHIFQSFAWITSWFATHYAGGSLFKPHILLGFEEQKPVFAWALMEQHHCGQKILTWATEPSGQYGDVLLAEGQSLDKWLKASLDFLKRLSSIDVVRLRHVRRDAVIQPYLQQHFKMAGSVDKAPYLDLVAYKNEAAYEARYSSVQRKRRKKIRRNLQELGPVTYSKLPAGQAADQAIDRAILEKNLWLKARGARNRVLGCKKHMAFIKTLTALQDPHFSTSITELRAGEKPVSWAIGFEFQNTHHVYITSHVHALTNLSPSRLHMDLTQRAAITHGLEKFDLMVPCDPYKLSWSSGIVDTADYYTALTGFGKLYGLLYLRLARPLIRTLYLRAPHKLLRIITPALHKD